MSKFFRRAATTALLSTFLFLACGYQAKAQSTTEGAIAGTVFDANNGVLSGAAILIHNDGTNAEFKLTSDDSGYFKAPLLPSGIYTVTVSAAGFSDQKTTSVIVEVGKLTSLQPHLAIGAVSNTVTVTGAPPLINTESPDFASNLSLKVIDNLPINGRRWSNFALLTPGVVADSNGFGLLSFRGISPLLNTVEVDGADDVQAFFSEERGRTRAGYSTSQASIQEFQVNTGVYSTEYGRAAGGVVNSITKSGTNQLHGSLFFYDRDNIWGSKNPFTKLTTVNYNSATNVFSTNTQQYKPKDWRKQWGFGVGGPLIKDKLFWFYTYDQYRRNFPGTAVANSPSAFFAAPSATVLSTLSSRLGITTTQANTLYYDSLFDLSQDLGTVPRTGDQVINTPKIDWQINSKNRASFLYHRLRWDSPGGVQTQATNGYAIDSFGTDFVKLDFGVAKLDTFLTSNLSNEVRYQYGRELNDEGAQTPSAYTQNHLTNITGVPTAVGLTTSTGFYLGTQYYSFRVAYPDERKWQVADTVNWVHGNHSLKFGADILHNHDLQNNLYQGNGSYTYGSLVNYISDLVKPSGSCNSSASSTATGTLPCYSSFNQGIGPAVFQLDTTDLGFFAQDYWKITPRLTLNLGIRYDYEKISSPYSNLISGNGAYALTANHPSDKNNFGPRAGFAYDAFGNGKTVVRGGYGLYYGRVPNGIILNVYENTGSTSSQNSYTFFGNTTGAPVFPNVASVAPSLKPNIQYFDKNMQNPQVHQFDLAVQQDMGSNTVLSVSYIGALSRELPNWLNVNLNPATMYTSTVTVARQDSSGATVTTGDCGPLTCGTQITSSVYSTKTINTAYNAITKVTSNVNASYNAFVAEIQNRSFKWVQFDANYTFSHALDFNQNQLSSAGTNGWYDPLSSNAHSVNYGNSNFNVPNRFVGWALFNLPSTARGWKSYLVNDWNLNPIFAYQNGLPYSVSASGSQPNGASSRFSSGLIGTGIGYLPQFGRNTHQQPHTAVFDLRAAKDLTFHEKYKLQLIGEAFNLFNHQNVTGVNSTAYSFNNNNLIWGYNGNVFGQVTNVNSNYAYSTRQVQLSMRLQF